MRKPGRKHAYSSPYKKRKLSSDARIIYALLKKQPQNKIELCKNAGIAESTFYTVHPLLEGLGIIKKTEEGYALRNYNELEEAIVQVIKRWKNIAFRYPSVTEIADDVGIKPETVKSLVRKTKEKTGWFTPNQGILESAREKLGEVLVCAARIRDGKIKDGKSEDFDYENDPEILEEAERFLKEHPELVPKLDEEGDDVVPWPPEALKYLGEIYKPKDRGIPHVWVVPR